MVILFVDVYVPDYDPPDNRERAVVVEKQGFALLRQIECEQQLQGTESAACPDGIAVALHIQNRVIADFASVLPTGEGRMSCGMLRGLGNPIQLLPNIFIIVSVARSCRIILVMDSCQRVLGLRSERLKRRRSGCHH